jgi:hypothetical protein
MVINKNGIKLNVERRDNELRIKILEQDSEFTNNLKLLTQVSDRDTGLILRSNKHPSFNKTLRKIFVRGSDSAKDNKLIKIPFDTSDKAQEGIEGIKRLLDKVVPIPTTVNYRTMPGGVSNFRMSFINRAMAQKLCVTGKDLYPEEVLEWQPTDNKINISSRHYLEHQLQACDTLNKSVGYFSNLLNAPNEHTVTEEQARKAVESFRRFFKDAYEGDYLIAAWRISSYIRGPDLLD